MSDNAASDIHLDHPPQGDDDSDEPLEPTPLYQERINADEPVTQEVPHK